jgi:hypothetical protein
MPTGSKNVHETGSAGARASVLVTGATGASVLVELVGVAAAPPQPHAIQVNTMQSLDARLT